MIKKFALWLTEKNGMGMHQFEEIYLLVWMFIICVFVMVGINVYDYST